MAPTLRGVAYGLSIFTAATTGLVLETALLLVLYPFPRWISRNLVGRLTTLWFELASFLLVSLLGLRLYVHGDPLPPPHARESALVVSNHPTRIDWMLLWPFFSECGVLSDLKIVLKVRTGAQRRCIRMALRAVTLPRRLRTQPTQMPAAVSRNDSTFHSLHTWH